MTAYEWIQAWELIEKLSAISNKSFVCNLLVTLLENELLDTCPVNQPKQMRV